MTGGGPLIGRPIDARRAIALQERALQDIAARMAGGAVPASAAPVSEAPAPIRPDAPTSEPTAFVPEARLSPGSAPPGGGRRLGLIGLRAPAQQAAQTGTPGMARNGIGQATRRETGPDDAGAARLAATARHLRFGSEPVARLAAMQTSCGEPAISAERRPSATETSPYGARPQAVEALRHDPAARPAASGAGPAARRAWRSEDVAAVTSLAMAGRPVIPACITWALPASGPPLQVERAGILACFILNAAMIPGWPPPKPFEAADPDSFVRTLLPDAAQPPSEADLLAFLRERSVREAMLTRLRTLLGALRPARRRHLLLTLAASLTALHAALGELAAEIERLGDEAAERDEVRERLQV